MEGSKGLIRKSTIRKADQQKLEIVKEIIANGVDLNSISLSKRVSDYLPKYKGTEKDFKIGTMLQSAKSYYKETGKLTAFAEKLCELGLKIDDVKRKAVLNKKEIVLELVKVVDLNDIKTSDMISDYLPQYKGTDKDFAIGVALNNVRALSKKGQSIGPLGELYVSLGLKLANKRNRQTAKYICQALDEIVRLGINVNDIKTQQMLSDLIPSTKEEDDFCVGSIFSHARMGLAGDLITKKLKSLNFDFTPRSIDDVSWEKKTKIVEVLLNSGVKLDEIKRTSMMSDFIAMSSNQKDYPVGLWVSMGKCYTADKKFIEMLKKHGLKPYVQNNVIASLKVLRKLALEQGYNINNLDRDAKASHFFEGYEERDIAIGEIIYKAKQKSYRNEIIEELVSLGLEIEYRSKILTTSMKYAIIADLVNRVGVEINSMHNYQHAYDFDPETYKDTDYFVGLWVIKAKNGDDQELQKLLLPLGLKPVKKTRHINYDDEFKKKIVRLLVANGIDINTIKVQYKLSDYLPNWKWDGDDIPIGEWFANARRGRHSEDFQKFLVSVGYKFEKKFYKKGEQFSKVAGLKIRSGGYDSREKD